MTAHPKTCPITGELLFFGYRLRPPYLTYYRASAARRAGADAGRGRAAGDDDARLRHHPQSRDLHGPAGRLRRRPGCGGRAAVALGRRARRPVRCPGAYGGDNAPVRWLDVAPCYVWHTMNAFEDPGGDTITVTGTRVPTLWRGGADDLEGGLPVVYRWTLDLRAGAVTEEPLDDAPSEYPRVADSMLGLPTATATRRASAWTPSPIGRRSTPTTSPAAPYGRRTACPRATPAARPSSCPGRGPARTRAI